MKFDIWSAPQGCSLSPISFIMFINDIIKHIQSSNIGLFADDIAVRAQPTSSNQNLMLEEHTNLQNSLTEILNWTKKQIMNLSITKHNTLYSPIKTRRITQY